MYILKIKPEILKKLENEGYGCITEIILDGEDETSARKNAQIRTWGNEIDQKLDDIEQKKMNTMMNMEFITNMKFGLIPN